MSEHQKIVGAIIRPTSPPVLTTAHPGGEQETVAEILDTDAMVIRTVEGNLYGPGDYTVIQYAGEPDPASPAGQLRAALEQKIRDRVQDTARELRAAVTALEQLAQDDGDALSIPHDFEKLLQQAMVNAAPQRVHAAAADLARAYRSGALPQDPPQPTVGAS